MTKHTTLPSTALLLLAIVCIPVCQVHMDSHGSMTHDETRISARNHTHLYHNVLSKLLSRVHHLTSISALLRWDEQVLMPRNAQASEARGTQHALLAGLIHDLYAGLLRCGGIPLF